MCTAEGAGEGLLQHPLITVKPESPTVTSVAALTTIAQLLKSAAHSRLRRFVRKEAEQKP